MGDRDGEREERGEEDTLVTLGDKWEDDIWDPLADKDDAKKADAAADSDVEGKEMTGLMVSLSVLLVTNLITVLTSSMGLLISDFSSSSSPSSPSSCGSSSSCMLSVLITLYSA